MNKRYVKAIILLSLVGIILSFMLVSQHYTILESGFENKSFCSINEWIDCDLVNASSYAKIFSIPVAGLGLIFYFVLFLYSSIAQASSSHKKNGLLFCFYLSLAGLLITSYFAYISFVKLGVMCLWCTGMYLVNVLIFLLLPPSFRAKWSELPALTMNYIKSSLNLKNSLGFKPKTWSHVGVVCLLFGLGIFVFMNISDGISQENPQINIKQVVKAHFAQEPKKIDPENRPMWGDPNASIKIVEFSDFQCPYCKRAAFNLKPSLADFKKDIAFYFVNYPLDKSCNSNITRPMHTQACNAARASLCASQQGKFWEYHDLIFKNQRGINEKIFIELAGQAGLDKKKFNQCIKSEEIEALIQKDIELAKTLGVSGTPAVFINGRKMKGWAYKDLLRAVLEKELNRSN